MGLLISAPLSCLGACAGSCACSACASVCGGTASSNTAKVLYYSIVFVTSLLALLFRYASIGFLDTILSFAVNDECGQTCLEVQAAYRICMALFFFFVVMGLMAVVATSLHLGQWLLKFIILIGLLLASFFVPQDAMPAYIIISRIGATVFLLLQIVVLITMAYDWNRRWTEDFVPLYLYSVLAVSALLLVGSAVSWFLFYFVFANAGCGGATAFITITLIMCVVFTLISISNIAPHGAILTSAIVTAYSTFVLYGALSSNPNEQCNPVNINGGGWNIIGLVIAAVTLAYRSFSLSRNSLFASNEKEVIVAASADSEDADLEKAKAVDTLSSDETSLVRWTNVQFHLLMCLAALYVTMVVSNWGTDTLDKGSDSYFNVSTTVMWVGVATGWVTMLLYVWTLVAPRLFPDRDFGVDLD